MSWHQHLHCQLHPYRLSTPTVSSCCSPWRLSRRSGPLFWKDTTGSDCMKSGWMFEKKFSSFLFSVSFCRTTTKQHEQSAAEQPAERRRELSAVIYSVPHPVWLSEGRRFHLHSYFVTLHKVTPSRQIHFTADSQRSAATNRRVTSSYSRKNNVYLATAGHWETVSNNRNLVKTTKPRPPLLHIITH